MDHKRNKPAKARAGCKLCKPWKKMESELAASRAKSLAIIGEDTVMIRS